MEFDFFKSFFVRDKKTVLKIIIFEAHSPIRGTLCPSHVLVL